MRTELPNQPDGVDAASLFFSGVGPRGWHCWFYGGGSSSGAFGDSVLAEGIGIFYLQVMSVREIKDKLAALSRREQDEVVAYLFHLRHADDAEYQATLSRRLGDKDPGHWLTPEQFEQELDKKERR